MFASVMKYIVLIFIVSGVINIARADNYYGTIYVDESTGIAGTAYNFSKQKEATAGALQTCKKKSGKKSCTLILEWYNGCAAAAWSPRNKSARWAIAETSVREAENNAIERCAEKENDPNCRVVSSICTKWPIERSRMLIFY